MHFRINNLQSKIILKVNTYFDYYLLEVYPVIHYIILLNKSTTKSRKIPVYLLFNKSQQNTIKYKSTKYYQVQRLVYNHILTCTCGRIWYVFFYLHLEQWENLLHVRVCSAYMVRWEKMMLTKKLSQNIWRIILNNLGFSWLHVTLTN